MTIEFTDRYKATGTSYPTDKSCMECDAMGIYPQRKETLNKAACESPTGELVVIGQKEESGQACKDDDYVFVRCPHCNGTRLKKEFMNALTPNK